MIDEDPSSEDIERFSGEEAVCPECGSQVHDTADICPKCFAYLGGHAAPQGTTGARQRWFAIIAIALVLILSGLLSLIL